ncbi:MAG TPA: sugar phosphate nucleotidyltransferase [Candidatus Eisenbacteria bacterium]|nr:sugar phosphate nucleotidyltransferase [Candidatus Eisenbacteria bacterium]
MYAVILAGGGGTRLWPLSTPEKPKPFLPLLGERSLLQATVDRLAGHHELPIQLADVTVVTDRRYAALVAEQLPEVSVIVEPTGRNTAAAVALATIAIDRDPDEVMLVLPADQRIDPELEGVFRSVLEGATHVAEGAFDVESPLVTLGVTVERAATEYGYLLPVVEAKQKLHGLDVYPLRAFEEKPTAERAAALQGEPGVAWNAGIFLWRRRAIRTALERYTALITALEPVLGRDGLLATAYDRLRPVSIDHAVMEGAAKDHHVVMGSMRVGWSDLGSWTALLADIGAAGTGRVIQPDQLAEAGPDDLVVERVAGRLTVSPGPRGILASTPVALLIGAAADRHRVHDLVRRIIDWEETS